MATLIPFSQPQSLLKKPNLAITLPLSNSESDMFIPIHFQCAKSQFRKIPSMAMRSVIVSAIATGPKARKISPGGEAKGFVAEMRAVAMKTHSKKWAKEGEKEVKEPVDRSLERWQPTIEGYLDFLVNSKLMYNTLEEIMDKAEFPIYSGFRNTGLERSEKLLKDLEWFKELGYEIPEPCSAGITYSAYLKEISEKDPVAFICHYYNIYFAHSAGGRMVGKKLAEKILDDKELEFYKWDGDLSQLSQNVADKLNRIAESWSREEKDHCLEETEKSFMHFRELLRLMLPF